MKKNRFITKKQMIKKVKISRNTANMFFEEMIRFNFLYKKKFSNEIHYYARMKKGKMIMEKYIEEILERKDRKIKHRKVYVYE